MLISEFFAGMSGRVVVGARLFDLSVVDLGELQVPSGRVGAVDPFVAVDRPLVTTIPAGSHSACVTVADVSQELDGSQAREAYLTILVRPGEPTRVEIVVPEGYEQSSDPDDYFGVCVDSGAVAFVDAAAAPTGMPDGNRHEDLFDPPGGGGWFTAMDDPDHLRAGSANIPLPLARAAENVVLTHSGWGDGIYPMLKTFDADGHLTGVHIDLLVLPMSTEGNVEGSVKNATEPGIFKRLFHRWGRSTSLFAARV